MNVWCNWDAVGCGLPGHQPANTMTLKKTDARVELPKLSYMTKFSELLHRPGLSTETQADGPTLGSENHIWVKPWLCNLVCGRTELNGEGKSGCAPA